MTVRELINELSKYPRDMEVRVEHQKQSIGTLRIQYIFVMNPEDLETNWEELKDKVLILRIR